MGLETETKRQFYAKRLERVMGAVSIRVSDERGKRYCGFIRIKRVGQRRTMKQQTIASIIALVVVGGMISFTASGAAATESISEQHAAISASPAAIQETTSEGGDDNGSATAVSVGQMDIPALKLRDVTVRNASVDRLVIVNRSNGEGNLTRTNVSVERVYVENATLDVDLRNITIHNQSLAVDLLSSTAGDRESITPRKNATLASRTIEGVEIDTLIVRTVAAENVLRGIETQQAAGNETTANAETNEPPAIEIGTATVESASGTVDFDVTEENETTVTQ